MRRGEVNGSDWIIPEERYKTGFQLLVPLSKAAAAVLAAVPRLSRYNFVFAVSGKRPFSDFSTYKRDFDKACGVTGWTLHDLRRTGRSLMSRAGVNTDHAERCLGHLIGGVRGTYDVWNTLLRSITPLKRWRSRSISSSTRRRAMCINSIARLSDFSLKLTRVIRRSD